MTDDLPVCTVDDPFMRAAYDVALEGYRSGGIPIGAVIVYRGEIIGRGHNSRFQRSNPILHGEMTAFENAGRQPAEVYRESTLYTTHSPCTMCAGTTLLFGVPRLVIGEEIHSRRNTNYLGSGKLPSEFLRSIGMEVTVHDDLACYEILERFAHEKPDVWAEDIGVTVPELMDMLADPAFKP
ncbi:nucleoside deaminase [Actinotalea fermentans]|uniref:tRNA-specific adenosine deaminase n=1 Tax=Actinotalea fermentans TaxID=43671 RepID=A0A511YXE5_9CELL|nr:nucleoside deaminase [Actinotalea fermentans]KGM17656.1 hypothetical protein N867_16845 [Actinotalea fermentans ATCC 43279 = JCM 9966 = DSM 3133]GEN79873.1 tRNA-specific adenosine deaminase [Actinotalea fermentans]